MDTELGVGAGERVCTTRVCAFDRAGEGWSGGKAIRQDGHQLASDLHALLRAAHVPGPYVLAGHSVGGTYALVYAAQYPGQVAGLALIDSATPYQFDLPDYPVVLLDVEARLGAPSLGRTHGHGTDCAPKRVRLPAAAVRATPHARSTPPRAS